MIPVIIPIGVINTVKSIIRSFNPFAKLKDSGASKANNEPKPKKKYNGIAIITIAIINNILNIFQTKAIFMFNPINVYLSNNVIIMSMGLLF